jgi:hypothetical protein
MFDKQANKRELFDCQTLFSGSRTKSLRGHGYLLQSASMNDAWIF